MVDFILFIHDSTYFQYYISQMVDFILLMHNSTFATGHQMFAILADWCWKQELNLLKRTIMLWCGLIQSQTSSDFKTDVLFMLTRQLCSICFAKHFKTFYSLFLCVGFDNDNSTFANRGQIIEISPRSRQPQFEMSKCKNNYLSERDQLLHTHVCFSKFLWWHTICQRAVGSNLYCKIF